MASRGVDPRGRPAITPAVGRWVVPSGSGGDAFPCCTRAAPETPPNTAKSRAHQRSQPMSLSHPPNTSLLSHTVHQRHQTQHGTASPPLGRHIPQRHGRRCSPPNPTSCPARPTPKNYRVGAPAPAASRQHLEDRPPSAPASRRFDRTGIHPPDAPGLRPAAVPSERMASLVLVQPPPLPTKPLPGTH